MRLFRLDSYRAAARLGLVIGIPLALLLGARGVSWAFDAVSGWTAGETLRAEDLNRLVARLSAAEAKLGALEADPLRPRPTFEATISDNVVDLGEQLAPLVAAHRDLRVTLERGTTAAPRSYTWNKSVVLPREQRLELIGAGYANGANELGVTITMNAAPSATYSTETPPVRRVPRRLHVGEHAWFALAGVKLYETENSQIPLSPDCNELALFTVADGATIVLEQSKISSTENVVNMGDRAYGRVRFGWTTLSRPVGVTRDVYAVSDASGWCHPGSGAVVGPTKGTVAFDGVMLMSTDRIKYLY